MTDNQVKLKDIETRKTTADADRAEAVNERKRKERMDKYNRRKGTAELVVNTLNARQANRMNLAGKLIGGAIGKLAGGNDPIWYKKNEQLVKDSCNIPFSVPLGTPNVNTILAQREGANTTETVSKYGVPGVMTLHFTPVLPRTKSGLDTVQLCANSIYSWVRHANSGHTNYESSDLFMYLYSMDSLVTYYGHLCQVYNLLTYYKGSTKYNGPQILRMIGYDVEDLSIHINDLRKTINVMGVALSSLYFPKNMPLYARHLWLTTNMFKDNDIDRAQVYLFVPDGIYTIESSSAGTALNYKPLFISGMVKYQDIVNNFNQMYQPIITDTEFSTISGDIRKVYGESELFYISEIDADYHMEPIYSEEVLTQINAGILCGSTFNAEDLKITQVNNTIKQGSTGLRTVQQHISAQFAVSPFRGAYVNFQKDNPSVDDVMVATRLISIYHPDVTTETQDAQLRIVDVCGTEILTVAKILVTFVDSETGAIKFSDIQYSDGMAIQMTKSPLEAALTDAMYINSFDWAPRFTFGTVSGTTFTTQKNLESIYNSFDFANYALIPDETLSSMHEVAALSLFNVPAAK